MPTPPLPADELDRRREAVEQCLREGFAPLGTGGGKGSATEEACRRLGINTGTLTRMIKRGQIEPDWSLYKPEKPRINLGRLATSQEEAQRPLHETYGSPPAPAFVHGPVFEYQSRPDNTYVFGAVGDNHGGSKYERLDVLEDLYEHFWQAGADRVFHTGNWIDGESRFNTHDLHTRGMDGQIRYLVETYPQRRGLETYAVHGDDHEGWYGQREGVDVGRYCEHRFRDAGRHDWHDLGFMEAHIKLVNANSGKAAMMSVVHPGGGSAYALSYSIQKIVESLEGGEKPAVALYGHYHKLMAANIRNVWCVQTGCCQDQTPFMRKKRLEAHIGGLLVTLRQDPETGAIIAMRPDMMRYFNRGYYGGRWSKSGPVVLPERSLA